MSTNKTPNYNLHAWEPTDDFLRAEMNENFADIDAILGEKKTVVVGRYKGDGKSSGRTIDVGRPILALLIENNFGERSGAYSTPRYGGLVLPDMPEDSLQCSISGTTFKVSIKDSHNLNNSSRSYMYLAWVE